VLEIAVFAGIIMAVTSWQERHLLATNAIAPAFELGSVDGQPLSLESLRGKKVVLHFWATWCGVCRREFGGLNAVQDRLAPDQVLLSIVADADDVAHVRQVMAEEHIRYPVLLGTPEVLRAFHVDTFPTNYYIDRHGQITSHTIGMSTRWAVRARLGLLD
jgi:thiol-disulfide isomerase/thioredoxin